MIEGRDKFWSPWTKNDNTSFNNLAAGTYTFSVRALSEEDEVSKTISYTFEVDGPLWYNWWFFPLIGLLTASLIFWLFRRRLHVVKKRNQEEKAQLEMQNRLLELEQKANQLQMNPHFIFNALNSIQATVAKEDYQDARKEITEFATLMRSILSNSKERVISLEDELKLLNKYVGIEKKCRALGFSYEVKIDSKIDKEEAMIPPMVIQPFVENAIVHGLKGVKEGHLLINFKVLRENLLEVEVIDNGIGYEKSKINSVRKNHKSVAIEVTKERLEALVKKNDHPVLSIEQISDEGGTRVVLKMPVEYNF